MSTAVVWFRRDLRLDDNPAWAAATASCDEVVALFVLDQRLLDRAGPHRRAHLLAALASLDHDLADHGGRLHLRLGDARSVVPEVVAAVGAEAIWWNDDVSPWSRRRDEAVTAALDPATSVTRTWGCLVQPPGAVLTKKGTVSQVFTPFYRTWSSTPLPTVPDAGDGRIADDPGDPLPAGDPSPLPAGTAAAWGRVDGFLDRADDYDEDRDLLAGRTSALSADLRLGTISPRRLVEVVGEANPGRAAFVRQLAWRDWYAHLLHDRPELATTSMAPFGDRIAWRHDPDELAAWKEGRTGYPVIDAAMRCLRATGTMPGRARMLVGSFLVKDLLIDWREGEAHLRHWLVDADPAQNIGNWQWVAGTGPDASPFFRIFNPVTQSRRFDADGTFLRRWVPELADLDDRAIHAPWEVGPLELHSAGVVLGETYPEPIVDHAVARDAAMAAYGEAKAG